MVDTPEEPKGNELWRQHLKKTARPAPEIPKPGDKTQGEKVVEEILRIGPKLRKQASASDTGASAPEVTARKPQRKTQKAKAKTPKSETAQGATTEQSAASPLTGHGMSSEELEALKKEARASIQKRAMEEERRKLSNLDNDRNLPKGRDGGR